MRHDHTCVDTQTCRHASGKAPTMTTMKVWGRYMNRYNVTRQIHEHTYMHGPTRMSAGSGVQQVEVPYV